MLQQKDPAGNIKGIFCQRYSYNCILNENLTHRCAQTGHFFAKSGHCFSVFKKEQGIPLPIPPLSYAPDSLILQPLVLLNSRTKDTVINNTITISDFHCNNDTVLLSRGVGKIRVQVGYCFVGYSIGYFIGYCWVKLSQ